MDGSTTIALGVVVFPVLISTLRFSVVVSYTSMCWSVASVQYNFSFTQSTDKPSAVKVCETYSRAWASPTVMIRMVISCKHVVGSSAQGITHRCQPYNLVNWCEVVTFCMTPTQQIKMMNQAETTQENVDQELETKKRLSKECRGWQGEEKKIENARKSTVFEQLKNCFNHSLRLTQQCVAFSRSNFHPRK